MIRVRYGGKVYTFDPRKQSKGSVLGTIVEHLPIPLKWKAWVTIQIIKHRGILVEDGTNTKEGGVSREVNQEDGRSP